MSVELLLSLHRLLAFEQQVVFSRPMTPGNFTPLGETMFFSVILTDNYLFLISAVGPSGAPHAEQELLREAILCLSGASGTLIQYNPTLDAFVVSFLCEHVCVCVVVPLRYTTALTQQRVHVNLSFSLTLGQT